MKHTFPKRTWAIWLGFFIFYAAFLGQSARQIFNPHGEMFRYYRILCAYDISFWIPFAASMLTVILGIVAIIPMVTYMFNIRSRHLWIWKIFFVVHLCAELFGHSYEIKFIQAIWHQDPYVSVLASIHMLVWVIPSHLIVFLYAFPHSQKHKTPAILRNIIRH